MRVRMSPGVGVDCDGENSGTPHDVMRLVMSVSSAGDLKEKRSL